MNTQEIKKGDYVFTSALFGDKPYPVLSVRQVGNKGAEIKTHHGSATFSVYVNNNNCRFATNGDF